MKVICTGLPNSPRLESKNSDGWVTIGREYIVLGVYGGSAGLKYRILGDDGTTPALQSAEHFELVFHRIPDDWIFRTYPNSEWVMTPVAWSEPGFWTAYFDGDLAAQAKFEQTALAMGALNGRGRA